MSTIDEMLKSFSDIAELRDFSEQQHKTILELTKKIDALKAKNKQLEDLLQQKTPVLVGEYTPIIQSGRIDELYEENICKMELKKLHDLSIERTLTYEETKKVDIYTKLLLAINAKPKGQTIDTKKKDTDELLRLVSSSDVDDTTDDGNKNT